MHYDHTQTGKLTIIVAAAIVVLYLFSLSDGFDLAILLTMSFIVLIVSSFSSLNVIVDQFNIKIKFGYGIFKKTFELRDVVEVKSVRNKSIY